MVFEKGMYDNPASKIVFLYILMILKSYNVYSNLIYSKKNKFNIRLEFANTNFLLKAYVPFWGKVTKNNMWLAFIEN